MGGNDAGLMFPDSFTIVGPLGSETVQPCSPGATNTLGATCQTAVWGTNIDILVVNNMPVVGYVNVLMDWDQNGVWSGSSTCTAVSVPEHVLINFPVPAPYAGPLSALGPPSFVIGPNAGHVWCRFSITETNVPLPWTGEGQFEDGESEDYLLEVLAGGTEEEIDFGDAPDPTYPTLLANNGARHTIVAGLSLGALIDAEGDGQPTAKADGDDVNPPIALDDEDGVTFLNAMFAGVPNTIQVVALVPAGTNAYLSAWMDFDGDGTWTNAGEQILADTPVTTGTNYVKFVPGAITATNSVFARFRLSTQTNLTITGLAPDGEVEDYEVPIVPVKWLQPPDLTTTGVDVDNTSVRLADDFLCNQTGPLTDFHIWTSFSGDVFPEDLTSLSFTLYLYADVPAGVDLPYSHPGEELWAQTFAAGTYHAGLVSSGITEWWFDPVLGTWTFPGDSMVFQYDFLIPEEEAFVQTNGTIYWLGVKFDEADPGGYQLGWKSSQAQWNDDACWYDGAIWQELRYGDGHELAPDSMDLAFAVTGIEKEEEEQLDFGDAPDPTYPTVLASGGARHVIVPGVFMGASVDAEPDGQQDPNSLGDDNNPPAGIDDEDGIILPSMLVAGSAAPVQVTASTSGFLNVWIDFNCDGDWADVGEQVFLNHAISAGLNAVLMGIPPPPVTKSGGPHSRWRFTTYPPAVPAYTNLEMDGEVEDYEVRLEVLDFGDAPDPSYPTLAASTGACHRIPSIYYLGATAPDDDPDGQPTSDATGDDSDGTDDEDGVTLGGSLIQGQLTAATVVASTNGWLDAWMDFNADGDWADSSEPIASSSNLLPGANTLNISVPFTAALGPTFARFRFSSSAAGLNPDGLATDGEVEDYMITIYQRGPDTNTFFITNITRGASSALIEWSGGTGATYQTQYTLNLLSTDNPPWTAWGPYVTGTPLAQTDTNMVQTAKFYRVVAPYAPPPP
ncbi:MAG: GEVED domain-containing protein [Kiritimatiellia bacterium]